MAAGDVTIVADRRDKFSRDVALATMRALNRAITATRADVSSRLNKQTGVRVKVIKSRMELIPPQVNKLEATLHVWGTPVPAIEYRAAQTPKGVAFTTGTGSIRFLKGAFIARMKTGHRGVYSRSRPSRSRKGKPRSSPALPIFQRYGPPLSIVALQSGILEASRTVGEATFHKTLAHELQRRLGALKVAA
jgi:hypothetical protein